MKKRSNDQIQIEDLNVLYDNVIVESIVVSENNGVYLPQTYEMKPEFGTVVKVGEGRLLDDGTIRPIKVKVGNKVFFNKYLVTKFKLGVKEYYVIHEEDILAYV